MKVMLGVIINWILILSLVTEKSETAVVFKCQESLFNLAYNGSRCTITKFRPPFQDKYNFAGINSFEILELRFIDSSFTKMPQMVFKMYENIEWLEVEKVGLEGLEPGCLYHARNLRTIIAPYNKLSALDKFTFYGAEKLLWINMSHNVIERIHPKTFLNLTNLEVLDFTNNRIGILDKLAFINQKNLKYVFLDGNRLIMIDSYIFHSCETLESVLLNDNYLDQLNLHLRNNHLTYLYAMNNRIKKLYLDADNKDFEDHNFYIELRNNMMQKFYVSDRLRPTYLSLAYNKLTFVGNITQLTTLTYLDLSYNQLEHSISNIFENLTQLQELYLSGVGMNVLDDVQFVTQTNMKRLVMSGNEIHDIEIDKLAIPPSIEELDLSHNNLSSIKSTNNLSETMPKLTRLDLSNNPLDIQKINELAIGNTDVIIVKNDISDTNYEGGTTNMSDDAITTTTTTTSDKNLTSYVNQRLSDLLMELHALQSNAKTANFSNYRRIENSENHLKVLNLFLIFLLLVVLCLFIFTIYLYVTVKSKAL